MTDQNLAASAAVSKPFVCHGEVKAKPCTTRLTQAEAWVPEAGIIAKVTGQWPSVKELAEHTYCDRCMATGRKAGLRFHRYPQKR